VATVGLIADLHGNVGGLRVALARLLPLVDQVLLAGDAMNEYRFSDEIVDLIQANEITYIVGNHELSMIATAAQTGRIPATRGENWEFVVGSPTQRLMSIAGKRLLMVHASPWPPYSDYLYESHPDLDRVPELGVDFLVLGHTHVAMAKLIGDTLVINPGSAGDARGSASGLLSYAILDVDAAQVTFDTFEDPLLPTQLAAGGK
jgi:putative phosphoesterase